MKEELTLTKQALSKAQEENALLKGMVRNRNDALEQKLVTQSQSLWLAIAGNGSGSQEMEAIIPSSNRSSMHSAAEDAIAEVKLQLAEEKNRRLDLEKELELQTSMRAETEVALKLLEKDIHEKQDTIISLRKQIEDIKIINLEMYRKLQVSYLSLNRFVFDGGSGVCLCWFPLHDCTIVVSRLIGSGASINASLLGHCSVNIGLRTGVRTRAEREGRNG